MACTCVSNILPEERQKHDVNFSWTISMAPCYRTFICLFTRLLCLDDRVLQGNGQGFHGDCALIALWEFPQIPTAYPPGMYSPFRTSNHILCGWLLSWNLKKNFHVHVFCACKPDVSSQACIVHSRSILPHVSIHVHSIISLVWSVSSVIPLTPQIKVIVWNDVFTTFFCLSLLY